MRRYVLCIGLILALLATTTVGTAEPEPVGMEDPEDPGPILGIANDNDGAVNHTGLGGASEVFCGPDAINCTSANSVKKSNITIPAQKPPCIHDFEGEMIELPQVEDEAVIAIPCDSCRVENGSMVCDNCTITIPLKALAA